MCIRTIYVCMYVFMYVCMYVCVYMLDNGSMGCVYVYICEVYNFE